MRSGRLRGSCLRNRRLRARRLRARRLRGRNALSRSLLKRNLLSGRLRNRTALNRNLLAPSRLNRRLLALSRLALRLLALSRLARRLRTLLGGCLLLGRRHHRIQPGQGSTAALILGLPQCPAGRKYRDRRGGRIGEFLVGAQGRTVPGTGLRGPFARCLVAFGPVPRGLSRRGGGCIDGNIGSPAAALADHGAAMRADRRAGRHRAGRHRRGAGSRLRSNRGPGGRTAGNLGQSGGRRQGRGGGSAPIAGLFRRTLGLPQFPAAADRFWFLAHYLLIQY